MGKFKKTKISVSESYIVRKIEGEQKLKSKVILFWLTKSETTIIKRSLIEDQKKNNLESKMIKEKIYIFDTTLRDGAQTEGVDFQLRINKIAKVLSI